MTENKNINDFIETIKNKKPIEIIGLFASQKEVLFSNMTKEDEKHIIDTLLSKINNNDMEKVKHIMNVLNENNY